MAIVDMLSYVNLVLACLGAIIDIRYAILCRSPFRILKLINGLVCLYVFGIYLYIIIFDMVPGTEWIRPGTTLLLAIITAGAIANPSAGSRK